MEDKEEIKKETEKIIFHLVKPVAYGDSLVLSFNKKEYVYDFQVTHWAIQDRYSKDLIFIPMHNIRSAYINAGMETVQ